MARILLAEDDASTRALFVRALKADGHDVIEVEDGQAALAQLTAAPAAIDIVVSDVEMPGMDGITLAQQALAANAQLKLLLISGYPEGLARAAHLSSPAIRCLAKPASLEDVRDEIRSLIG
jgi:CheY-like chemotaxis protein